MTTSGALGGPSTLRAAVDSSSLPAQIHEALEEAIIHGDLPPGSRIRPDDIAAAHGVSRIPVREALSSLHEAGWVEMRPRYGVYVKERNHTELQELFEARAALEAEIARLAALRHDAGDAAALGRIVEATKKAAADGDVEGLSRASVEFNAALRTAARNSVLAALSLGLEKRARFYFFPVSGMLGSEWGQKQAHLADAVASGDGAEAAGSAHRYMIETGEAVFKLLGPESFSS
ncbi:GntR family transcriptional regulator [Arthrobacter sp. 35W]|uniref:GntR family transcriptional regulator n=1 Tax=Arthrobacter sp. 35W TaxID=1132441 RepID=UPI000421DE16|nr:GntR family transcriptional regulator [Arthrobacter sp. 35W]